MKKAIALEHRLRRCRNVRTLGVRTNLLDYSTDDLRDIRRAPKIYYPSVFYADLFDAMGKEIFPSYHTYKCVQDKIKQTALFHLLEIPPPIHESLLRKTADGKNSPIIYPAGHSKNTARIGDGEGGVPGKG